MAFRWRLGEADAEKYGIDGWHEFSLKDWEFKPASELARFEQEIGWSILLAFQSASMLMAQGQRAIMFLTLRSEGIEMNYRDFDPVTMQCRFLPAGAAEEDDADPPAGSTEPSELSEEPSASSSKTTRRRSPSPTPA